MIHFGDPSDCFLTLALLPSLLTFTHFLSLFAIPTCYIHIWNIPFPLTHSISHPFSLYLFLLLKVTLTWRTFKLILKTILLDNCTYTSLFRTKGFFLLAQPLAALWPCCRQEKWKHFLIRNAIDASTCLNLWVNWKSIILKVSVNKESRNQGIHLRLSPLCTLSAWLNDMNFKSTVMVTLPSIL